MQVYFRTNIRHEINECIARLILQVWGMSAFSFRIRKSTVARLHRIGKAAMLRTF
jgi:hypothetical protein